MKLVYICSPLRGDVEGNINKAHEYCRIVMNMNAIPIAPHTIYTKYLDDREPEQRKQGLQIGREILLKCDELWAFGMNISEGMEAEIKLANENEIPVHLVRDPENPDYSSDTQDAAEQISLYSYNC